MRSDSLEIEDTLELAELEEVMISIQRNIRTARLRRENVALLGRVEGVQPGTLGPAFGVSKLILIARLGTSKAVETPTIATAASSVTPSPRSQSTTAGPSKRLRAPSPERKQKRKTSYRTT